MRTACLLLTSACLLLGIDGCALRATTDFGPGDEPHHQSVGAGAGPFPNLFNSGGRNGAASATDSPATNREENAGGVR